MTDTESTRTRRTLHREDLLRSVAEYMRAEGLHNFTLRQAAVAAGTTHKVLLYHFGSADELIIEANDLLRADAAAAGQRFLQASGGGDLTQRLATLWKYWERMDGGAPVFYEMIGLAMADPERFGEAGRRATLDNLKTLAANMEFGDLDDKRKELLATLALAVVRGLAIDRSVTGDRRRTDAAFAMFTEMAAQGLRSTRRRSTAR